MATAKKNVRAARLKRADRKNISVGQAHIRSTFNNTIVRSPIPRQRHFLEVGWPGGLQGLP